MTYENRLTANYAFGTLTNAAAISDTTLVSTDFATYLPSGLSTTLYVPLTLQDPSTHNFEIVWVNAHTTSSNSATVVRAKESTTARAWPAGTLWTIAPTLRDGVLPVTTRSALPADPHIGLRAEIQDEQVVVEYAASIGWINFTSQAYRANNLLVADAASVVFSGIPSTLKRIQVTWQARSTASIVNGDLRMRINADTSANYYCNNHVQQQTTITSFVQTGLTYLVVGDVSGASDAASDFASGEIVIPGWNAPGSRPAVNVQFRSYMYETAANSYFNSGGGLYAIAGPYTSLTFLASSGNLKAGSEFTVYGSA